MNKHHNHDDAKNQNELQRALKNRHVQLIALGGIIGSGYFLGTAEVVQMVGPSVFLAYLLGGLIVYLTMLCMGELAVAIPISGSFINYTAEFISPTIACGVGWSYWLTWVAYIPAECIAGGIIMEHFTGVNGYVWAMMIGLIITIINTSKVGTFGEIEFWLSSIKIVALLSFIILSMLIFFGIIHGPAEHGIIGTKYLLNHGGLFPNGYMSLLMAMVLLLVNYQGSEIIGLAAGESINPGIMIPQAVRNITYRILFIYIIPIFCLVLIFPWDRANLKNSVFADALSFHGLHWASAVTSFVTLIATLSCSNSGVYGVVRSLHALARNGMAPKYLTKLNTFAVPQNAGITTLLSIWCVLILSYFFGQTKFYITLLLVSGFTGAIAWISLCWSQIKFRQKLIAAGYSIKDLKFYTPCTPYTGMLAIVLMLCSLIFLAFNQESIYIIAFIIGILTFILPMIIYYYGQHHVRYSTKFKLSQDMSFDKIFPKK